LEIFVQFVTQFLFQLDEGKPWIVWKVCKSFLWYHWPRPTLEQSLLFPARLGLRLLERGGVNKGYSQFLAVE
jgi:hypothetical protein